MNELEKVEKLRERANVTYEEAKKALEEHDGDLLEAMIALEKEGKTKQPKQESYSTTYEKQASYTNVKDKVDNQFKEETRTFGSKIKHLAQILWEKGSANYFLMKRHDEIVIRVPVWVFVVVLLFAWHTVLPLMLISLFFGCKYEFVGEDDLNSINKAFDKAGKMADKAKDEFDKL